MKENAFLSGENLYLRPLSDADAQGAYTSWLNDAEVCSGNSHHVYPYTENEALSYIQACRQNKNALTLAMVLKEGDTHIGNIALQSIQWVHRTAEFAILLGDRRHWGKGYGREAGALLVAHGFSALGLNRIACGTFAGNSGMRQLALSLGMKEEGVRRQAAFKDGKHVDVVEFGILREEWDARTRAH